MSNPINISVVSYLNSKPFIYGIEKKLNPILFNLQLDTPADCAEKLITGKADLGLVPVSIIPQLPEKYILSDFCIGANGKVDSVNIYSEVPLADIQEIILDYQSRTSVMLTKVLAKNFWHINPKWKNATPGFEKTLSGTTAALIIGDRTFALKNKYTYTFDLAQQWNLFTNKPFVFACWVANKNIANNFIEDFNKSIEYGINNIDNLIPLLTLNNISSSEIADYLKNKIDYRFDNDKKQAMHYFMQLCNKL